METRSTGGKKETLATNSEYGLGRCMCTSVICKHKWFISLVESCFYFYTAEVPAISACYHNTAQSHI